MKRGATDPEAEERLPDWLERPEHTADELIRVRASTVEKLFERAAWGLFFLLSDPSQVVPRERYAVRVEAADREALLVRWLSELNYLHQTRHVVFGRFEVQVCTDMELTAAAWGEPIDASRHAVRMEIKAVTYHGLSVFREGPEWKAQVLFDV